MGSFPRNAEDIWHIKKSCMAEPTSFRRTELRNSRKTSILSLSICADELSEQSLNSAVIANCLAHTLEFSTKFAKDYWLAGFGRVWPRPYPHDHPSPEDQVTLPIRSLIARSEASQ